MPCCARCARCACFDLRCPLFTLCPAGAPLSPLCMLRTLQAGLTALHLAAREGAVDAVRAL